MFTFRAAVFVRKRGGGPLCMIRRLGLKVTRLFWQD